MSRAAEEAANASPLYWRIIRDPDAPRWIVVCMQWFDEYGADRARYRDDTRYQTEAEAEAVARLANHDERARVYRADIDRSDALDALIKAAKAVAGNVDAVYGEEHLGDLQRAVAAYEEAERKARALRA